MCLDSKIVEELVSAEDVTTYDDDESDNGDRNGSAEEASPQPSGTVSEGKAGAVQTASENEKQALALSHGNVVTTDVNCFPVNASALRPSVEKVPEGELCTYSLLAPLLEAVAPEWDERQGTGQERVKLEGSSAFGESLDRVRKRRDRDFDKLHGFRKDLVS